jgi:hypothetical protein
MSNIILRLISYLFYPTQEPVILSTYSIIDKDLDIEEKTNTILFTKNHLLLLIPQYIDGT